MYLVVIFILINNINCSEDVDDELEKVKTITVSSNTEKITQTTFMIPDDKWTSSAIKDIAYYLRNYKYNEWDRRYHSYKPAELFIGYYSSFPVPSLRSLHWKVYEHCHENFYKCVIYLHGVIEESPFTRGDDTVTIKNENVTPLNDTLLKKIDEECKNILHSSEISGLPFEGPIEKFQWRTTASYYMCWYTMLETPALAMIESHCDNFANCLDPQFGYENNDPRADNKKAYVCASYSFCPDPCCSLKHTKSLNDCYDTNSNPCYEENSKSEAINKVCIMNRHENKSFRDIILNRLNVTCHCNDEGFIWKSEFGMCVDINECVTGDHNCSGLSENCLNTPGSFKCICAWGYALNAKNICVPKSIYKKDKIFIKEHVNKIKKYFKQLLHYFGF